MLLCVYILGSSQQSTFSLPQRCTEEREPPDEEELRSAICTGTWQQREDGFCELWSAIVLIMTCVAAEMRHRKHKTRIQVQLRSLRSSSALWLLFSKYVSTGSFMEMVNLALFVNPLLCTATESHWSWLKTLPSSCCSQDFHLFVCQNIPQRACGEVARHQHLLRKLFPHSETDLHNANCFDASDFWSCVSETHFWLWGKSLMCVLCFVWPKFSHHNGKSNLRFAVLLKTCCFRVKFGDGVCSLQICSLILIPPNLGGVSFSSEQFSSGKKLQKWREN